MSLFYYFIIALILSLSGSIPIGLITLTIIQKTIQKGRSSGLLIALGATVMEFIYTYLALISLDLFTQNTAIGNYIKVFAILVFFSMGIYFLIKKNSPNIKHTSEYDYFDFLRGVVIGAMNMLIIPFWIFLGIWLEANGIPFETSSEFFIFSLGSAIGAFIAFWVYILLSEFIATKISTINRYTNKAIAILFLGLGCFQLIQFFVAE